LKLGLIGQRKALGIAVRNDRPQRRYSGLLASLKGDHRAAAVGGSDSEFETANYLEWYRERLPGMHYIIDNF
jgi:hypothetical protein